MTRMARLSPTFSFAAALVACGGPRAAPPDEASHPPAATAAAPSPAPSASVAAAPSGSASAAPPAGAPSACADGMLLVDGSFCTDLEVTCLEQFHAPQNNLWVCKRVREPTRCVGSEKPLRYCIDKFEFPNREGQRPMVMQNFYQAQAHCAKAGKRICTEEEWTLACEGPERKPFPYGYVRDPKKCHGDQSYGFPERKKVLDRDPQELERLWKGKVSGSQPDCVTDYGVHDMPGNADELAASVTHFPHKPKSNFQNVTTGGPWYYGVRNMCRPKIYSHDESFAYYYLSWRCCAEPDGKPTDPRSPKQIEAGWSFERVLHIAKNSWKLPLNPKWPGDEGYVSGGPR